VSTTFGRLAGKVAIVVGAGSARAASCRGSPDAPGLQLEQSGAGEAQRGKRDPHFGGKGVSEENRIRSNG
jgi:hypothetical protein